MGHRGKNKNPRNESCSFFLTNPWIAGFERGQLLMKLEYLYSHVMPYISTRAHETKLKHSRGTIIHHEYDMEHVYFFTNLSPLYSFYSTQEMIYGAWPCDALPLGRAKTLPDGLGPKRWQSILAPWK